MQEISSDQVSFLILKLRQFHAKYAPAIPDSGDNVADDADREVLFDLPDDTTEEEIRAFFQQLNEDEAIELRAMLWVGSGTYEDWTETIVVARQDPESRRAETFLSAPIAALMRLPNPRPATAAASLAH
jgi:Protein of unknown function (DUF3775)